MNEDSSFTNHAKEDFSYLALASKTKTRTKEMV
jgi:hypothetical protein